MNRQQRRAASSGVPTGSRGAPPSPASAPFTAGLEHHKAGRFAQAITLYRRGLELDPRHVDSLNFLGLLTLQQGKAAEALPWLEQALRLAPRLPALHFNIAAAHRALGNLPDALRHYAQTVKLQPENAGAHNNMGLVLQAQQRLAEAATAYERALALAADARVMCNLGNVRVDQGALTAAARCYEQACAAAPDMAEAHNGCASVLLLQGRPDLAAAPLHRALALRPGFVDALNNQARICLACGEVEAAVNAVCNSLAQADTAASRALFVTCISAAPALANPERLAPLLRRALAERWGRPADLARPATAIVVSDSRVARCIALVEQAWPDRLAAQDMFGATGLAALADNALLGCVLLAGPLSDRGLERLLTSARAALLAEAMVLTADAAAADDAILGFWCALAEQCFANEYAFVCSPPEEADAGVLRSRVAAALKAGAPIAPLCLVALAAYLPLMDLVEADGLLTRPWPGPVAALLARQVQEPIEERRLRATLPRLTPVPDAVSQRVRDQYEANPYPRWVSAGMAEPPTTLTAHLSRLFPAARLAIPGRAGGHDILVVGCGTGQQPIEIARLYRGARVLAVDLSLNSLAYAQRQSSALGVQGVSFGQADLLQLGALGRRFDAIEVVGVLHHLADPMAGWRTLLPLLRQGGVMHIGLYSALARQDVVAARAFIAKHGLRPTPGDMRRCRQMMLDADEATPLRRLSYSPDFASLSGCRDLLFHVQEHRLTLPQIAAFLADTGLALLGFDVAPGVAHAYRTRFATDPAMTSLANWDAFEREHPAMFGGMYMFWVQKPPG